MPAEGSQGHRTWSISHYVSKNGIGISGVCTSLACLRRKGHHGGERESVPPP